MAGTVHVCVSDSEIFFDLYSVIVLIYVYIDLHRLVPG